MSMHVKGFIDPLQRFQFHIKLLFLKTFLAKHIIIIILLKNAKREQIKST